MEEPQNGALSQGEAEEIPQASASTEQQPKSQETHPEECSICWHVYGEEAGRPCMLPCGHTFCSQCLDSLLLLKNGSLLCPTCRACHLAANISRFPLNYDLENMIKSMRLQKASSGKVKRGGAASMSNKLRSMIQEQKSNMESTQGLVQQELAQLGHYRRLLASTLAVHKDLLVQLDKVTQQHREAMKLLQEEDVKVETLIEEGNQNQQEMIAGREQLEVVTTAQVAFATLDSADHSALLAEEWVQQSKEQMPNASTFTTSCRLVESTKMVLKAVDEAEKEEEEAVAVSSGHLNTTLMEVVQRIKDKALECESARSSARFRSMVEAGEVFGTKKNKDGQTLFSKVTAGTGDSINLHSMTTQPPTLPAFNFTFGDFSFSGSKWTDSKKLSSNGYFSFKPQSPVKLSDAEAGKAAAEEVSTASEAFNKK